MWRQHIVECHGILQCLQTPKTESFFIILSARRHFLSGELFLGNPCTVFCSLWLKSSFLIVDPTFRNAADTRSVAADPGDLGSE